MEDLKNDGCIGYLPSNNDDEFVFPFADGTAKLSGRDHEFRVPTPRREQPVRSEDLSVKIQGESGESQPAEPTDDTEARGDVWSIQGDFVHRHHTEPRVELNVSKEETFPIPLNHNSMLPGLLVLIWTSWKKRRLTITGMSIQASICQTPGEDLRNLLH